MGNPFTTLKTELEYKEAVKNAVSMYHLNSNLS
jgi:hypothetical protein